MPWEHPSEPGPGFPSTAHANLHEVRTEYESSGQQQQQPSGGRKLQKYCCSGFRSNSTPDIHSLGVLGGQPERSGGEKYTPRTSGSLARPHHPPPPPPSPEYPHTNTSLSVENIRHNIYGKWCSWPVTCSPWPIHAPSRAPTPTPCTAPTSSRASCLALVPPPSPGPGPASAPPLKRPHQNVSERRQ